MSPPLTDLTARQMIALVQRGEVSARELVAAHVRRIEEVDGLLNAVVVRRFEEAMAEAAQADERQARGELLGPLHGLPVTVKESFDLAGYPSTAGVPHHRHTLAATDAPLVARLRQAGAIVLGKTNLPQLMTSFESDNPLYGRTNNPWNLRRSSGGSTSGEGAIIACGGSPLGLGSDGAGSIRQPSHACAICGLKATHGRFTMLGHAIFDDGSTYTPQQAGPMARCVDDLELAMSVLAKGGWHDVDQRVESSDWSSASLPGTLPGGVHGLRIGVYESDGILEPSPAIRRAVREAAEALSAAGAIVEPFVVPDPLRAVAVFFSSAFARGPGRLREFLGRDKVASCAAASIHPLSLPGAIASALSAGLSCLGQRRLGMLLRILPHPRQNLEKTRADHEAYRQFFLGAMRRQRLDALLGPTTGTVALPHGTANIGAFTGMYTVLYNALGFPAGVAPVTRVRADEESDRRPGFEIVDHLIRRMIERGSAGMPVGVQVAGKPWREDVVLAVMRQIERHVQAKNDADYPHVPIDPVHSAGR